MIKVSVITINFNNGEGLKKTITSVLEQDTDNIEYIVIDGGSSDSSLEVIKRYSGKIHYWVSESDRGIYHAMNKGISKSNGDYLIFLNSGDIFSSPQSVNKLTSPEPSKDLIYGNLLLKRNGQIKEKCYPDFLKFSSVYINSLPHPATLIKKSLFDKFGLYDENLKIASDWKFFLIALFKEGASYEHRGTVIATFSLDGISSNTSTQSLIEAEKEETLRTYFPHLADDILTLKKLTKLRIKVAKNPISQFIFKKHLNS